MSILSVLTQSCGIAGISVIQLLPINQIYPSLQLAHMDAPSDVQSDHVAGSPFSQVQVFSSGVCTVIVGVGVGVGVSVGVSGRGRRSGRGRW